MNKLIKSKKDFKYYLNCDLYQSELNGYSKLKLHLDRRYKFYKLLRKSEYYLNCKRENIIYKIYTKFLLSRYKRLCEKYMWTIPPNVCEEGLAIIHNGPIVISGRAKIGKNCRIHVGVNIGYAPAKGFDGTPTIGNNVYLGPGCKLFGPIIIGDDIAVGANAVVNNSFREKCTIAGVPAKIISYKGSEEYIRN